MAFLPPENAVLDYFRLLSTPLYRDNDTNLLQPLHYLSHKWIRFYIGNIDVGDNSELKSPFNIYFIDKIRKQTLLRDWELYQVLSGIQIKRPGKHEIPKYTR
ncbi:hypothetical protein RF11_14844 [Thelohanellus kitauei]|uniref:Uncharacterized protein n=1 Tax=Thelohanellus kitauei TaxID=669202 RepID=A0A0C2MT97_THEKT|nr:hypothetical protein RF11_14844 [Thelohanellus kitauei]